VRNLTLHLRPARPRSAPGARSSWCLCVLMVPVIGLLWIPVAHRHAIHNPQDLPWALVSLAILGAGLLPIHVRIRQHAVSMTATSEATLVAVVFLSPHDLALAVTSAAVAQLLVQRQKPIKALFNLLNPVLGAGVGEWVYLLALGSGSPVSIRGLGAAIACCLAIDLVCLALLLAIMGLNMGGRLATEQVVWVLLSLAVAMPAYATLGFLAVSAVWLNRWSLALLAVLTGGAWLLVRTHHRLREKYANLELLYQFSHSLAGLSEATEVLGAILGGAEDLLACRQAELVILRDGRCLRSLRHPTGAVVHDESTELDRVEAGVAETGHPLLVPRTERSPELLEFLGARGWRDAMVIPLSGGDDVQGLLIVGDRLGETSTFVPSDLRLLETLAAHSSVALRGSELLDRLRNEVEARSHEALHDSLTGLGNRAHFSHRLELALEERGERVVGVVMIDLDNFKEINDTLGHHTGDALLQEAATRLIEALGPEGTASRIGGDEFAVVLGAMDSLDEVVMVARRIIDAISAPLTTGSITIGLLSSLGIAVAPDDGVDASTLLRRADVAMYVAKEARTGIEIYDPATDPNTTRRLRLTSDLRSAVADDSLELWFQPKAELTSGRITGVEALCRWSHPIYGNVPPDEFIPLAEQSGTIGALTTWVMDQALRQLGQWDRLLRNSIDMAVNVSARNLMDVDLVARLECMIAAAEVNPTRLTVELTESSIMSDPDRAERILAEIAQLGVRIAIDDFGTGYSSLSRLNRLPVSEIKVDKSFVTDMSATTTEPIVAATIEIASSLGHTVTAEGVEDRATWNRLQEMGCDSVQGYFLARPMPAEICTEWLLARQPKLGLALPA
jgi:diguanylate cyclase (GGDEF)-like protein